MPFTVKANLKPERRDDKTHAVRVRVSKDRVHSYLTLGIYLPKSQWNPKATFEKKNWVKSDNLTAYTFNQAIRHDVTGLIAHGLQHPELSPAALIKSYRAIKEQTGPKEEEPCFLEFVQKELARGSEARNPRSTERMTSTYKKLADYAGQRLPFSALTMAFLRDFITHLEVKHKNLPSTIHADITMLRKFASHAMAEGLIDYKGNPFLSIKLSKKTRKKQRLDMETFEQFRTFPLTFPFLTLFCNALILR